MDMLDSNLDQTGQHYMVDKDLIKFIVSSADLKNSDTVLEIGYGHGALTKELAKRCKVIAIDIEKFQLDMKNTVFVHGNILNMFEDLKSKYKFNKIVANIPYNISEPLMKLLFKTNIELCVFTMGKNFTEILTGNNRIGIIANHFYKIHILKLASPKAFRPIPRTESAVVKLILKEQDNIGALYKKIVILDDKKLKNVFEKILINKTKREIKAMVDEKLFEKRLYELSNDEFIELDEVIRSWIGI